MIAAAVERDGHVVGDGDGRVRSDRDVAHEILAGEVLLRVDLGQLVVGRVEQGVDPDARGCCRRGDRILDGVVNLAVEPVEEDAGDDRSGGVDQEVAGDQTGLGGMVTWSRRTGRPRSP